MNPRPWFLALTIISLVLPQVCAQEAVRDLHGGGQQGKFLTANQLDRWLFEGEAGETIIAHVISREFDPILELARTGAKDEKPLLEVDDPGSESRFAFRLPEKGKYEIRIHAFKFQGGGNYTLAIQRFQAKPLTVGTRTAGSYDRDGKSHFSFSAVKDRILVPELKGVTSEAVRMLDSKGRELKSWAGSVTLERDGLSYVVISGQPSQRFELIVREGRRFDLAEGKEVGAALRQGEADVWNFQGKPGDFRLLEVDKKGEMLARLIYAPLAKEDESRLVRQGERPEILFLPVASRGGKLRFAVILGREARYQLQLVGASAVTYKLTLGDPSVPLIARREVEGIIPVGGTVFYSFKATPGQLIQAGLTSSAFVPMLRLYDDRGVLVGGGDEVSDALASRVTHMVVSEGLYHLQVSSAGDGGGGSFRQMLKEATVNELKLGERAKGTLQPGTTDFLVFQGQEGKTVFLNVRSGDFEPTVSVRGSDGIILAADEKGNATTGSLVAIKLPSTGRYTVWIASRRGAGEYTVRLIDGD